MKTNEAKATWIAPGRGWEPWRGEILMSREVLPTDPGSTWVITRQVVWELYETWGVWGSLQRTQTKLSYLWLRTSKHKIQNKQRKPKKISVFPSSKVFIISFHSLILLVKPLWQHRLLWISYLSTPRPRLQAMLLCLSLLHSSDAPHFRIPSHTSELASPQKPSRCSSMPKSKYLRHAWDLCI